MTIILVWGAAAAAVCEAVPTHIHTHICIAVPFFPFLTSRDAAENKKKRSSSLVTTSDKN